MTSRSVATVIIGPNGLLRDCLASLLSSYSYRVINSYQATAEIAERVEQDEGPRLVLFTAGTMEQAVAECASAREIFPNCKFVTLLEKLLDKDFPTLALSNIDGCVPLQVSQDVLMRTLDLVMADGARIIVLAEGSIFSFSPSGKPQQESQAGSRSIDRSRGNGSDKTSAMATKTVAKRTDTIPPAADAHGDRRASASNRDLFPDPKAAPRPRITASTTNLHSDADARQFNNDPGTSLPRTAGVTDLMSGYRDCEVEPAIAAARLGELSKRSPSLSERERQIVEGLIKGQPNKTIARGCGITEATVKVHMKAILRKVSCSNRTQVAVWALEHVDCVRGL